MTFPCLGSIPETAAWNVVEIDSKYENLLRDGRYVVPGLVASAVPKRRSEFYSGRWCAAKAIADITGKLEVPNVNSDRSPCWPQNIVGSISHSEKHAIAVVDSADRCNSIGVDIQSKVSNDTRSEIGSHILNRNEFSLLNRLSCESMFDVFFSAKESLYKALYPKCLEFIGYLEVEVINVNKSKAWIDIKLLRSLQKEWQDGQEFRINYEMNRNEVLTYIYF